MLLDPRANPKSGKAIAIQKRRFGHGFIHAENLPIFGAQSNRALPRLIGRLQPLATRIRPHKSPKSRNFKVFSRLRGFAFARKADAEDGLREPLDKTELDLVVSRGALRNVRAPRK